MIFISWRGRRKVREGGRGKGEERRNGGATAAVVEEGKEGKEGNEVRER